ISYFSIGQGEKAITEIKHAFQIAKIDVKEEVIRGFGYLLTGKCQEAISEFDFAIELDEKNAKWAVVGRFVSLLLIKQMTTFWPMIMQVSNQLDGIVGSPEKLFSSIGFLADLESLDPSKTVNQEMVHQVNNKSVETSLNDNPSICLSAHYVKEAEKRGGAYL